MTRNVPVSLFDPYALKDNSDMWLKLNLEAKGNRDFTPIEIKAFYVIGLISDICLGVDWLLKAPDAWPNKYLPAFALFASGVDLFGRCLTGNSDPRLGDNLRVGFHYLARPNPQPPATAISPTDLATIVVTINICPYTVQELVDLRNYSAHGQATVKGQLPGLHCELLDTFPKLMGDAMEVYWKGLQTNKEYCNRMASAKLEPYSDRAEPLKHILDHFSVRENSIGSLFYGLNWHVENCG